MVSMKLRSEGFAVAHLVNSPNSSYNSNSSNGSSPSQSPSLSMFSSITESDLVTPTPIHIDVKPASPDDSKLGWQPAPVEQMSKKERVESMIESLKTMLIQVKDKLIAEQKRNKQLTQEKITLQSEILLLKTQLESAQKRVVELEKKK